MHSKVTASPRTVRAVIGDSRLPARALSPTFRRITRPLGPLQRRLGAAAISPSALLRALNSGALSPAPPYEPPAGLVTLEQTSPGPSCPTWVPSWLKPWLKWIALALAVLAVVVVVVFALVGPWWVGVVIGAVLLALAVLAWLLSQRCAPGAAGGRGIDLGDVNNPDAVAAVPPQPGFHLDGSPAPIGVPAGSDSPEAAGFRIAVSRLAEAIKPTEFEPPEKEPADLGGLRDALLEGLDPELTVTARTVSIVLVTDVLGWQPPEDDPIEPIMAAPEFPQPMYEPLRDISQDLLLPGLDAIPPDTVSLLDEERTLHRVLHGRPQPRDGPAAAVGRLPDRPARQLLPAVLGRERLHPHARGSRRSGRARRDAQGHPADPPLEPQLGSGRPPEPAAHGHRPTRSHRPRRAPSPLPATPTSTPARP